MQKILIMMLYFNLTFTQNFPHIRLLKEKFCHNLVLNTGFQMTLERESYHSQHQNFLESYAAVTYKFFTGQENSSIVGLLVPLMPTILFFIAFLASLVIFILYLFPGFFTTRKEFIKKWKQNAFFGFTIFCFLVMIICIIFFTINLNQSIQEAKYTACFYYLVQYDFVAGLNEKEYSFIGFDNIETNIAAFKSELVNFNSILNNLNNIQAEDFTGQKSKLLESAKNYANKYMDQKIQAYSINGNKESAPILIESLTNYIQPEIELEFAELEQIAQQLVLFTDSGLKIIEVYQDASDVLVAQMINVMNYIVDGFKFLIQEMELLDGPIEGFISYMNVALAMLIVLSIVCVTFIPIYLIFFFLKNFSDKNDWTVRMMKGWLVGASIIGLIFSVFFIIFLYANLVASSSCYYMNEVMVSQDFFNQHSGDLNIDNEKVQAIIENCFDPEKSQFKQFFNANGEIVQENNNYIQKDIRTKPKEVTPEEDEQNNQNGTENQTDDQQDQNQDNTNTTSNTTEKKPVTLDETFDISLLSDFQSFVLNYLSYKNFFEQNISKESPNVNNFYKEIENFRDGISPNFADYEIELNRLKSFIKCNDLGVALNIRNCEFLQGCMTVKDTSIDDMSQKISYRECVQEKSLCVEIFTALKKSLESGAELYSRMLPDLKSQTNVETPGYTSTKLRSSIINIQPDMAKISETFQNSFAIFEKYGGTLTGLTNCYIATRQVKLLEAPLCYKFRPKLYNTLFYIFLMNLIWLCMNWGIFLSIKYSGNLRSAGMFGSKTTLASGFSKSKPNEVSFMENSQIINQSDTSFDKDEDEDDDYFSDEEEEDEEDDENYLN